MVHFHYMGYIIKKSLDMVLDSDRCEIIEEGLNQCPLFHTNHMIEILRPTCISFSCYVSVLLWLLPDPLVTGGDGVCWVACKCSSEMIVDASGGTLFDLEYRLGFWPLEELVLTYDHPFLTEVGLSRRSRNMS